MKNALTIVVAFVAGVVCYRLVCRSTIRLLRKRIRELKAGEKPKDILRSVTQFLFVTTQIFALGWVSVSYGIATYSTIVLMQPFPVTELSQQAIDTILKVVGLKVIGNIFEHNDGPVFGTSCTEDEDTENTGGEG